MVTGFNLVQRYDQPLCKRTSERARQVNGFNFAFALLCSPFGDGVRERFHAANPAAEGVSRVDVRHEDGLEQREIFLVERDAVPRERVADGFVVLRHGWLIGWLVGWLVV